MFGTSFQSLGPFSATPSTGSRVNFEIPRRGRFNSLYLVFLTSGNVPVTEAQIASEVGDIELVIDGQTKWKIPGWLAKADAYGMAGVQMKGTVPLLFATPCYDSAFQRADTSFGMNGCNQATLYVNFRTVSAVASIQVYADWDESSTEKLGAHRCLQYQDFQFSADGVFDQNTLQTFGPRAALQAHRLYFPTIHSTVQPAGTMTAVANGSLGSVAATPFIVEDVGLWTPDISGIYIEADGVTRINNASAQMLQASERLSGKYTHPTCGLPIRYDGDNANAGVWPMAGVSKLRLRATLVNHSTSDYNDIVAGNARIVTAFVDGLGNPV